MHLNKKTYDALPWLYLGLALVALNLPPLNLFSVLSAVSFAGAAGIVWCLRR